MQTFQASGSSEPRKGREQGPLFCCLLFPRRRGTQNAGAHTAGLSTALSTWEDWHCFPRRRGFLSQPHFPSQLTFSTLLLPLAAPDCLKACSSSSESWSILCLPPAFGKSESILTHASLPHSCSRAGANQSASHILTQAQQVPRCANVSLTYSLPLINAKILENGQAQS